MGAALIILPILFYIIMLTVLLQECWLDEPTTL